MVVEALSVLVRVFSDVLVAFLYFDICHYRQSNLAIKKSRILPASRGWALADFYPIKIFNYESSLGLFQSVSDNYLQLHKCKPSFHWLIYIDYYGKYFEPNLHSLNSFDKEKTF